MEMDPAMVRRKMEALTEEELRRAVTDDAASYEPEALAIAREVLAQRAAAKQVAAMQQEALRPPPRPYEAQRFLTSTVLVLVGAQLLACVANMIGYAILRERVTTDHRFGPLFDAANAIIVVGNLARPALFLITIVIFCVWLRAMYLNLPALGATNLRFTPGAAVGQLFIPFLNLVNAFVVMKHLWIESQPEPARLSDGTTLPRSATLVGWWWGAYLGTSVLSWMGSHPHGTGTSLDAWVQESYETTVTLAGVCLSGALFMAVVRGVARRQRDQHDDLLRRQPIPPPVDRLR